MGLLGSIREAVEGIEPDANGQADIAGAYWCDECSVRVPVSENELEDERNCPECGESMRLERSPDSGHCAC